MRCDLCGSTENIYLVQSDKGNFRVCKACSISNGLNIANVLSNNAFQSDSELQESKQCPVCGMTLTRFKTEGKLGCAQCAKLFHYELLSLLRKNGRYASYDGKCPINLTDSGKEAILAEMNKRQDEKELNELYLSLEKAVCEERFEEAAVLRDKIKAITNEGGEK